MGFEIERIALGALLHDIGKLVQFAVEIPEEYKRNNEELYQPNHKGYYTHSHALFTAYFIEQSEEHIPPELYKNGGGDSLINLAGMHHKPETPLQWVIAEADRLSSGIDRDEFKKGDRIPFSDAVKTRLIPVFETLFNPEGPYSWRYRLDVLSAQSVFPEKDTSDADKKDYNKLYQSLKDGLSALKHRKNPQLWLQHFDSLLRAVLSFVPSARVGMVIPDVSLYDHSRSTASLAVALYRWHSENRSLREESIKRRSEKKFLLVSGDFYGIQNFIFAPGGEEQRLRSKILRGRSLYVSLLAELAAYEICRRLDISFLSVVLCAGGKFHLIAPNTESAKRKIEEASEEINRWLVDVSVGESAIGISQTALSPEEFLNGNFRKVWLKHIKTMDEKKYCRYELRKVGGVRKNFLDRFRNNLYRPLCPLCGKRPSDESVENDSVISRPNERASSCRLCRDQVLIGTKVVKKNRMGIVRTKEGELRTPLLGRYQLIFGDEKGKKLDKFWDLNIREDGSVPLDVTFLPINGYVPVYTKEDEDDGRILSGDRSDEAKLELIDMIREGAPKTFTHIAATALRVLSKEEMRGIDALGVLKADVDYLGAIFACGFEGKRFTLSRLATLSRSMNNFFSLYLPYALMHENNGSLRNIYTVFAGGDDLFLVGPWNRIKDVALLINKKFRDYTCCNEKIHLSAGITLHKSMVPVDIMAEWAEESLERSKNSGRNRITMFSKTVDWDSFEELTQNIFSQIREWYDDKLFSTSFLYRIVELTEMADRERHWLSAIEKGRKVEDMNCFKWRPYLGYQVLRNVAQGRKDADSIRLAIAGKFSEWIDRFRGALIISLWSFLYENRKRQ